MNHRQLRALTLLCGTVLGIPLAGATIVDFAYPATSPGIDGGCGVYRSEPGLLVLEIAVLLLASIAGFLTGRSVCQRTATYRLIVSLLIAIATLVLTIAAISFALHRSHNLTCSN